MAGPTFRRETPSPWSSPPGHDTAPIPGFPALALRAASGLRRPLRRRTRGVRSHPIRRGGSHAPGIGGPGPPNERTPNPRNRPPPHGGVPPTPTETGTKTRTFSLQNHGAHPPPANPAPTTPPALPISLVPDATAGRPRPKARGALYAPYGRLIPCQTVITVDSSSLQTPIVGLITEDIHHAGQLVIPAGTEVHGTAQTDRSRERIASGNSWTLVWREGEELRLRAIALDREFDDTTQQAGWGITDGSAGLRGRLIQSDDWAEVKLFAATLLSGATQALTDRELTLFGPLESRSLDNAPLRGAEDVLGVYAERIRQSIERDGFYIRVPSGKPFYLYVLQTIDRSEALAAGSRGEPPTPASDAHP